MSIQIGTQCSCPFMQSANLDIIKLLIPDFMALLNDQLFLDCRLDPARFYRSLFSSNHLQSYVKDTQLSHTALLGILSIIYVPLCNRPVIEMVIDGRT